MNALRNSRRLLLAFSIVGLANAVLNSNTSFTTFPNATTTFSSSSTTISVSSSSLESTISLTASSSNNQVGNYIATGVDISSSTNTSSPAASSSTQQALSTSSIESLGGIGDYVAAGLGISSSDSLTTNVTSLTSSSSGAQAISTPSSTITATSSPGSNPSGGSSAINATYSQHVSDTGSAARSSSSVSTGLSPQPFPTTNSTFSFSPQLTSATTAAQTGYSKPINSSTSANQTTSLLPSLPSNYTFNLTGSAAACQASWDSYYASLDAWLIGANVTTSIETGNIYDFTTVSVSEATSTTSIALTTSVIWSQSTETDTDYVFASTSTVTTGSESGDEYYLYSSYTTTYPISVVASEIPLSWTTTAYTYKTTIATYVTSGPNESVATSYMPINYGSPAAPSCQAPIGSALCSQAWRYWSTMVGQPAPWWNILYYGSQAPILTNPPATPNCVQSPIASSMCENYQSDYVWPLGQWHFAFSGQSPDPNFPSTLSLAPGCSLGCGACTIVGGNLDLFAWPDQLSPSNYSRNGTITAPASVAAVEIRDAFTFTSPTVYISLDSLSAYDWCSEIGTTHTSTIIPVDARSLSWISLTYGAGEPWWTSVPFVISMYSSIIGEYTSVMGTGGTSLFRLSLPAEIQSVDPAWANCKGFSYGILDPPSTLVATTTAIKSATAPGGSGPTTSASPASSLSPVTPTPTASASPSAIPETTGTPSSSLSTLPAAPTVPSGSSSSPAKSSSSPQGQDSKSSLGANDQTTSTEPSDPTTTISGSYVTSPGVDPGTSFSNTGGATFSPVLSSQTGGNSVPSTSNDPVATFSVGSSPVTASAIGGDGSSVVVAGGDTTQTLQAGGSGTSIGGQPVSVASGGGLIVGSGSSASIIAVPTSADPLATTAIVTLGGQVLTATQRTQNGQTVAIIGSQTLTQGVSATQINGQSASLGSSGLVAGGSTASFITADARTSTLAVATVTLGSQTIAITQQAVGSQTVAVVNGQTLSAGGSGTVIDGQTVSVNSAGIVQSGPSGTASVAFYDPSSSTEGSNPSASFVAAVYTVLGILGASTPAATPVATSAAVFTASGTVYTASPAPGSAGVFVLGGTTLSAGGSPVTLPGGAVVSAQSTGILVDGLSVPLTAVVSPANLASAIVTASGHVFSAAESPGAKTAVVDGSITLSVGGPGTFVAGQTVSLASGGLVIGSSTKAFTGNSGIATALFTTNGRTFTAVETPGASTAIIDGSVTLTVGGSAIVVAGQTLSLASGGLVVGSATQPFVGVSTSTNGLETALVTTSGHTFSAVETSGAKTAIVDGSITLSIGGADTMIDGQTVSLATSGLVVGGSTQGFGQNVTSLVTSTSGANGGQPVSSSGTVSPAAAKPTSTRSDASQARVCCAWAALLTALIIVLASM